MTNILVGGALQASPWSHICAVAWVGTLVLLRLAQALAQVANRFQLQCADAFSFQTQTHLHCCISSLFEQWV